MSSQRTPVTSDTALFTFYDIESLANVFTLCAYTPRPEGQLDTLEIFFLADDPQLVADLDPQALYQAVVSSNPGLPAVTVSLWNLGTEKGSLRLAELMGMSDADQVCHASDPGSYPRSLRPVCDTDDDYDPRTHPFLAGYNSMNYDMTMLAKYFEEAFPNPRSQPLFQPTTARTMRTHNDRLFNEHIEYMPRYLGWDSTAAKFRMSMLRSGRHLDVSRLNELQTKAALKRLLGMLGRQIKESDKLSHDTTITTVEDLYELLSYNVSDCLGLAQLFQDPAYSGNFDLKAGLLAQYDETRFTKSGAVRKDRLAIDSSSAKFVGRILAPYTALNDIEAVSFNYPHPEIAKERGIEPMNVLDAALRFFEETVAPNPETHPEVTDAQREAHARFMEVVRYYRSIEGKNFNDSEEYADMFDLPAHELRSIPKRPNNVPYFHADATPSSCFATFSTGGIHGAEVDQAAFEADRAVHLEQDAMIKIAKLLYPEPAGFIAEAKRQHNQLTLPDGSTVDKALVLIGSDPEKVRYRKPKKDDQEQAEQLARAQDQVPDPAQLLATQRPDECKLDVVLPDGSVLDGKVVLANRTATNAAYREAPSKAAPELFIQQNGDYTKGSTKLHPSYNRTSAGLVIHEDFTSYYPNLLRNMRAFYNPELGEDRYTSIFFEKERLGAELKKPGLTPEEKARLNTLRNGTKLILNSASGAGDATHRTPIRMNNQIISMRIIGQIFSWWIGQAQTQAGGRIISTNTDGLYSVVGGESGFDEATNNQVLAEQQKAIDIDIEPELMFLISKDSNNRLELEAPAEGGSVVDSQILAAGGGSLACHAGPTPTKALSHPAVTDFALARYLPAIASRGEAALAEPFDPELGRRMILEAIDHENPVKTLMLFQNVIAASRGSITYPFAVDPLGGTGAEGDDDLVARISNPRALQMVNRVFVVKHGTPGAVSLLAAGAWKVNPASQAKRRQDGKVSVLRDPIPLEILRQQGWAKNRREAEMSDGLSVLPEDRDVVVRRITRIDPTWSMLVINDDLHTLSPDLLRGVIESLDLDIYTQMLDSEFTESWRNTTP